MLEGQARHSLRLANLARGAIKLGAIVYAAADQIRVEARHSITEGSVSGKGHVPSLPGEPPNADTHDLDSKIITTRSGPLEAEVRSTSKHAVPMEYGTKNVGERPYMRPAVKKTMPKVRGLLTIGVKKMVQES